MCSYLGDASLEQPGGDLLDELSATGKNFGTGFALQRELSQGLSLGHFEAAIV